MFLRICKTVVMSIVLSLFTASMVIAAAQYPSDAGTWDLVGTEKVSARIKGFGGGSDKQPFQATAHLNADNTFELGTWQQTKKKLTFILDEVELESMINDYLQYASGEYDIYVTITKSSGKATMSSDGTKLTAGTISVKFTIDGKVSGVDITGSGTYSESFKGTRVVGLVSAADTSAQGDEAQPSEFVKSFAGMIVNTYLKKNGK